MRDKYDGRDKRLREWLVVGGEGVRRGGNGNGNGNVFSEKLESAKSVILEGMKELVTVPVGLEGGVEIGNEEKTVGGGGERIVEKACGSEVKGETEGGDQESTDSPSSDRVQVLAIRAKGQEVEKTEVVNEEGKDNDEKRDGNDERGNERVVFRVGIFCEMGRHRSVAMVEELARLDWPGWDVEVVHRDVEKNKRKMGKNEGQKHGRGTRRGFSPE